MDDRILAKILHWIVGPSNRDHLPNLTLTTTRSGKQYLSVKKAEREIGTSYLQSILSFTRSVLELVSVAVGCYASNHWSWSDQDHFSFVDVTFLKNSFVSNFISGVLKPWC